jgi:hypothetical protein
MQRMALYIDCQSLYNLNKQEQQPIYSLKVTSLPKTEILLALLKNHSMQIQSVMKSPCGKHRIAVLPIS